MKSKFDKFAKSMLRADGRLPLCYQSDINKLVSWIPAKDSKRLLFIYDEDRFTDDSDWIFYFEGYGIGGYLGTLRIRICIKESRPNTGYVVFQYREVKKDGDLDPKVCAEFLRLGEDYLTTGKPEPVSSKMLYFDGYSSRLKVANRTQSESHHTFHLDKYRGQPVYCLTTMMERIVEAERLDREFFQRMKKIRNKIPEIQWYNPEWEYFVTYNQEMDEFNRKGVHCPHCESDNINYIDGKDRRKSYWHCKGCGHQFRKENLVDQT